MKLTGLSVVELIPDQPLRALEALQALGYKPSAPVQLSGFADPTIREGWIRDKGMMVFQLEKLRRIISERGDAPK